MRNINIQDNMNIKKQHSAFSLIEVIFVLVILGIISSIGSSILAQVYESYIIQNALYKVNIKTELVANQIVNRLNYAIEGTTISKNTTRSGFEDGTDWIELSNITPVDQNFTTIEWIGYDNDSFSATERPGWSGLANYVNATVNQFTTPGSNLSRTRDTIFNLSGGDIDINTTTGNSAAVIFAQATGLYSENPEIPYNPLCMGLVDPANTTCISTVRVQNDTTLEFRGASNGRTKMITERYKLAWSAYALVPTPNGKGLNDLWLHYNYQPWNGESYNDTNTPRSLLMTNISVFKFTENGGVIQFKLCAQENIGQDFNLSTCKEKVVL